jgi:hypothetical protein
VAEVKENEMLMICGDMNGHVGLEPDGFESVHGGYGYGVRNLEGEMFLEFAEAAELAIMNTWFKKDVEKRVTYESGGCRSQIDYVMVRGSERSMIDDVKVIAGEECIPQHRLVICVLNYTKGKFRRCRERFVSKCKIWRLKDVGVQNIFLNEVQNELETNSADDVDGLWKGLKDGLLKAADKACGCTKGRKLRKETWWWNDDVAHDTSEKRRLFKIW